MRKAVSVLCTTVMVLVSCGLAGAMNSDMKAKVDALKPEGFPTDTIEFMVVYKAGGGMDVTARVLAKYVEKYTGSRIAVINKTGAGGLIGHAYFATQAKNDGHFVGILANSFWTDALTRSEGKWSYKDMQAVGFINAEPRTWVVSTSGRLANKSLKEVIDMAKENPDTIKVGMTPGMQSEFQVEAVEMATGAKFLKVPYQGGRPQVVATLGNHIDIAQGFLPEFRGHYEDGKIRILGNCGDERYVFFPLIPTFKEVVGIDYVNQSWRFAAVPKGVPADRVRYLEAAIDAALRDPECIEEFDKMGVKVGVKYMDSNQTWMEIERLYKIEKEFLVQTGRLAQ